MQTLLQTALTFPHAFFPFLFPFQSNPILCDPSSRASPSPPLHLPRPQPPSRHRQFTKHHKPNQPPHLHHDCQFLQTAASACLPHLKSRARQIRHPHLPPAHPNPSNRSSTPAKHPTPHPPLLHTSGLGPMLEYGVARAADPVKSASSANVYLEVSAGAGQGAAGHYGSMRVRQLRMSCRWSHRLASGSLLRTAYLPARCLRCCRDAGGRACWRCGLWLRILPMGWRGALAA